MGALALTVLVAAGASALLVNRSVRRHFDDYVSAGARSRVAVLTPVLEEYYAAQGSWSGVAEAFEESVQGTSGRRGGAGYPSGSGMEMVLTDADGHVVYDTSGRYPSYRVSSGALRRAYPVRVEERVVGYLLPRNGPRELEFTARLNQSLIWAGALASLVAITLGLLLIRTVVRPLHAVRDAARRIGAGELSHRVPIHSGDEIGEVARQFNEMAAALERDEELRRSMMADIAHELRNPLAVIRGQVEALQDGVFELSEESFAPIHAQVLLLGRLVDDLRDLALVEMGRLPLHQAEMALDDLVQRVAGAFQPRAREKGLTLSVESRKTMPPVCADGQRVEQVLANLLSNALRHAPSGGAITVRVWAEADWVGFSVEDTGSGIAPEDLPHLFDRFYRVDKARSRADGGTGLGLSIAKQLVEAHGGEITVRSVVGEGSTFTVRLPRHPDTSG